MTSFRHLAAALLLASFAGCSASGSTSAASPAQAGTPADVRAQALSARVIELIVRETGAPQERVIPTARFSEDLGLDELDMIELVMKLEEEFEIEFTGEAFERMLTVADVIEYVRTHAGRSS